MQSANRLSIFSRSLDVSALVTYMLGAVVPLVALAYVAQKYVLPTMVEERQAMGLVALIMSIGVLSLASYVVLRRLMKQSLQRMAADNQRLEIILEAARALAVSPHRADAAQTVAGCARRISGARAAFVAAVEKSGSPPEMAFSVIGQAGDEKSSLWSSHQAALEESMQVAVEFGRLVLRDGEELGGCPGPVCCAPIGAPGKVTGALLLVGAGESDTDSLDTLAALASVALRHSEAQDVQRNFFVQMTDLLLSTLDHHLDYNGGHSRRVAHLASIVGRALEFDEHRLERLYFASLLHDVGMLKISPDKHAEERKARKHPLLGSRMLSAIRLWEDLAPFVLHHHEWYDGGGYPQGLAGDKIPLEARVITLVDAVDAMVSSTSYRDPLTIEEMSNEIREASGSQFDPEVARTFLGLVERGEIDFDKT